ncbi:MAG: hypothetical protein OEZ68_18660 [Gammaproteobacteria bacterium]|nr:hypothetical protein [Gammaproteobacteria bacterium]MDH5802829.1 hypothetical protein [Gammaproteobacteria bacterium]
MDKFFNYLKKYLLTIESINKSALENCSSVDELLAVASTELESKDLNIFQNKIADYMHSGKAVGSTDLS